jgi:small subunit ribosomal protein S1
MLNSKPPGSEPDSETPSETTAAETNESFADILTQYERDQKRKPDSASSQIEGIVVAVSADSVILDIGYKSEGILPLADFQNAGEPIKVGDKLTVAVKGRNPEGYYELSRFKIALPTDWSALEKAFAEKATIIGRVTGVIKGGLSVDVGVRAFMPASRSGARDAAEMEKLVEQEIRCRIVKLDVADEDVVVDRRIVAEDEERATKQRRFSEIREGDVLTGEVRSLADYGAFIDLGGVDGLLHVAEISWSRIAKPEDVLSVGQRVDVKVIKVEPDKRRISLSMKQLQDHPWDAAAAKYKVNDRVRSVVTRVLEFGAFVELEPGVEGLIHVSEMSWSKKMRIASDIVKPGDTVDAIILGINPGERRIALGLKQALGDPWADAERKFAPGTAVEGPITKLMNFGAFVQLAEGVEGMVHVSEIAPDRRINHPQEVLKVGQVIAAQVLAFDKEKRQIKLSIKKLVPTGFDEYLAEHKSGDIVTGRLVEITGRDATVELGEGIRASCRIIGSAATGDNPKSQKPDQPVAKADLSSLTSMLSARWKQGGVSDHVKPDALRAGQIRSFRICRLDAAAKQIELELAP